MKKSILVIFAACVLSVAPFATAHEHYNAGVIDLNGNKKGDAGEQLALLNFPTTGLVAHMVLQPSNTEYGGYYSLDQRTRSQYPDDYFTFTALSDGTWDILGENHAATGAFIKMVITSVVGPEGGSFGFWEGELGGSRPWSQNHKTPTRSILANQPVLPSFSFQLSEGIEGNALEDPQGHIHSRGWTATTQGTYTVGFQLIDTQNIQTPSQIYYITFIAGSPIPEPSTVALLVGGMVAGGVTWYRSRRKAGRS